MADNAPQIQYRQEFIAAFEQHQSLLRESCTTEAVIKGNQATFLVAGSGSASAVSRGLDGMIPARADVNTQSTAILVEWHDLVRKTNFNIFESQGDQRAIMQMTSIGVLNRKIDADILTELATGTQDTGAATTASVNLAMYAKTILGNAAVPWDGNITAIISPAFEAYLMQAPEFSKAEYVNKPTFPNADPAWRDRPLVFIWLGVVWIVHPNVAGVGTSSETCFMFHKSAIGNAYDSKGLQTPIGYDEEQDYSWARATCYFGSKLLQNTGVVVIAHDGSAFAAQ